MNQVNEAMYGSSKSSYQRIGNARMIVRHNSPVQEHMIGARGRNIEAIFIESAEGERLKYPLNHLAGARAMGRHISNGGTFQDDVGTHIIGLSEEYRDLQRVNGHVFRNRFRVEEAALNVRSSLRERLSDIRHSLAKLSRTRGYEMHVESLNEDGDKEEIPEEKVQEEIARLKELLMVSENDENLIEALGHAAMVMMREKPEEDPEAEQLKGMLSRGDLPLTRPEWEGGDAAMLNQDNIQGFLDSKGIKLNMKNLDSEMQQTLIRFLTAYGEFSVERDTSQDLMNAVKQLVGGRMEMSAGRSKPTDKPQDFASREIALAWKLGDLAPKLNNDFLSNFVANVSEKLKSSGEMGAQRVSRDEAKIINLILKGAQGAAPAPMEGRELREINEVQDWFEQFDPTKLAMAKYQETLLREKLEKEVEEDEEEDDSVMSEDEVWETSMEFVNTKDTPDELKVMANEISRTDLNRIIENIEEVWVGDIANEVREILAENLAEVLEADEDEYKDEKDVRPPTCKKCGEEHYGACPLYDSVEEAKKGLRPNKVEDNMMRRLGKGRKGDVASGPPEKHYDDKYSRMAAKHAKPKESAVDEVSPPGWEKTVKKMKKHKEIDNPWALAWHMKNKGYKASESIEEIKEVARLMELSGIKLDKVSGEKE